MARLRLIVTGGIGVGKSEVVKAWGRSGVIAVLADRLGHEVLEDEAFTAVRVRWPQVVEGRRVDRRALADIVFADRTELAVLEGLVHPDVARRIGEAVSEAGVGDVALELSVPKVMDPTGWTVVVVDAIPDVRLSRLRGRGMTLEDVERRMAAQPSRADWLSLADYVVDNSGDLATLEEQVGRLLAHLRRDHAEQKVE
ncbi:MAG: dephospho-CoA kinase [Actinomycetota bacterium]